MKKTIIYLTIILSIGFALRINGISSFSMFGDEVWSVDVAGHNIRDIPQLSFNNMDGPLFHIVLHYWIKLVGTKELYLRLLSVIFGLGGILLTFFICHYLLDDSVAILAGFLISISSFIILFNRTIRWYSISYFFELLFLYIFIKAIKENKLYYWILYLFIACLSMYTRFTMILFLISASIVIFLFYRKNSTIFKNWLLFQIISVIIILISLLPHIKIIFCQLTQTHFSRAPIKFGTLGKLVYIIYSFWFGQTIMPYSLVIVAFGFVVFALLMYKFILLYYSNFIHGEKKYVSMLIIFFLVPVLGVSISKFSAPYYIMSSSALLMIFVSLVILSYKKKLIKIAMVSFVIAIQGYSLYNLYTKQQYLRREIIDSWPEMARYVYSHFKPGDAIIYDSISFRHYLKEISPQLDKYLLKIDTNFEDLEEKILKNKYYKRVWYVNSPLSFYLPFNNSFFLNILAKYKFSLSEKLNFDEDKDVYFKIRIVKREFSRYRNSVNLFNRID